MRNESVETRDLLKTKSVTAAAAEYLYIICIFIIANWYFKYFFFIVHCNVIISLI